MERDINELIGKILINIENTGDEIIFTVSEDEKYRLYHEQDCCESVYVEDVAGDLQDLINSPILIAQEVSNDDFIKEYENSFTINEDGYSYINKKGDYKPESYTWTFYKLATIKGYVTIRFLGESNGYYSESVNFGKVGESKWD